VLGQLSPTEYPPDLLVSPETGDDAAVYRLAGGPCLVQTVDFFTPIVDDPFDWGRIAAANAASDVYAMGGRPALALNLVAWPVEELPLDLLARVLEGGAKVAAEAGMAIVGGHSIHDPEPKYGMAVTGFVEEERLIRNSTAPPDARLILTKPLGTGIISTALKRGRADPDQVRLAVETMTTLNASAAGAMVEAGAQAATDVTGFGLLGHLHGMLRASGVAARIDASAIPFLPGTRQLAEAGIVPSGTRSNLSFVQPHVDWGDLTDPERLMLADAQTSGGLLIAATEACFGQLALALEERGVMAAEIGQTLSGQPGRITVKGHPAG
jgi:selenide,water dikinase